MLTKDLMPLRALLRSVQFGSFWPGPNWHMEPVRSSTIMRSSGLTLHGEHAVAVAFTVSSVIPMILPNQVGTFDWDVTTMPLTPPSRRLQPGTPARQEHLRRRDRVVDGVHGVLRAGGRAVLPGDRLGHRRIGKMLRARERGGVRARLQLALHEHRVADVHHETDGDDHQRHRDRRHDQDLAALVGRGASHRGAAPRLTAVETSQAHLRTERHRWGYGNPSN